MSPFAERFRVDVLGKIPQKKAGASHSQSTDLNESLQLTPDNRQLTLPVGSIPF